MAHYPSNGYDPRSSYRPPNGYDPRSSYAPASDFPFGSERGPEFGSRPDSETPPKSKRSAANGVLNVLTTVILVVALAFTVVVVATTITSGKGEASLFGWKPYVVLSDSMQQDFQVGDIVVTREVDPATLQPGDIIAFATIDPDNYGEVFTHKIRESTVYEGEAAFVTYGTTTGDNDEYPALASRVQGKYAFAIPKAGYVFDFFKSPAGYVVLVLIPFTVLIALQIRNIVRLLREGKESESRAALDAERRRVAQMEAELARLRASAAAGSPQAHGAQARATRYGVSQAGAARNDVSQASSLTASSRRQVPQADASRRPSQPGSAPSRAPQSHVSPSSGVQPRASHAAPPRQSRAPRPSDARLRSAQVPPDAPEGDRSRKGRHAR